MNRYRWTNTKTKMGQVDGRNEKGKQKDSCKFKLMNP